LAATKPYIQSSEISARLRALVELRTWQINGCACCVDLHSREARAAGEGQQLRKEQVDLTLIVASMNAWNRIAISFRQGPAKRAE
jgi:AhpD family alkylhydroperoxidase